MSKYVKAYTVAIGNISLNPLRMKQTKKVLSFIRDEIYNFIGLTPVYPHGTLCLYKTRIDAERAKRMIEEFGVKTGNNIAEVEVLEEYLGGN